MNRKDAQLRIDDSNFCVLFLLLKALFTSKFHLLVCMCTMKPNWMLLFVFFWFTRSLHFSNSFSISMPIITCLLCHIHPQCTQPRNWHHLYNACFSFNLLLLVLSLPPLPLQLLHLIGELLFRVIWCQCTLNASVKYLHWFCICRFVIKINFTFTRNTKIRIYYGSIGATQKRTKSLWLIVSPPVRYGRKEHGRWKMKRTAHESVPNNNYNYCITREKASERRKQITTLMCLYQ